MCKTNVLVFMKATVFWDIKLCILIDIHSYFEDV
jgi:hypothetical protein